MDPIAAASNVLHPGSALPDLLVALGTPAGAEAVAELHAVYRKKSIEHDADQAENWALKDRLRSLEEGVQSCVQAMRAWQDGSPAELMAVAIRALDDIWWS